MVYAQIQEEIGLLGIALLDHPMGQKWVDYAVDWVDYWMTETVDEGGSWPESSHYARVSYSTIVQFAAAARNAGVHDFFTHPTCQIPINYRFEQIIRKGVLSTTLFQIALGWTGTAILICN